MKLLLLKPPKEYQVWAGVPDVFNDQRAHVYPPMGIMQLSAYLKANTPHDIHMLDAVPHFWTTEETARRAAALKPDVIGMTATSHGVLSVAMMARALKAAAPDTRILLGGPFVSAFPEYALAVPEIDVAVHGDGEEPTRALLDVLADGADPVDVPGVLWRRDGEVVDNGPAEPFKDLDALPLPDREGLPNDKYYTPSNAYGMTSTVMGSRGCPNRCVFCDVPHRFRARSPAHVVDELEECVNRYGIEEVHFIDDIFNISTQRVVAIAEEILRRNVTIKWGFKASCRQVDREMLRIARRAGCFRLHYGVETHSNAGLEALQKDLTLDRIFEVFAMTREEGLVSIAYMMIGCPHEASAEDIRQVKPFIRKLDPDYVVYSLFTPYPDTRIFQTGAELGLWAPDVWTDFLRDPRPGVKLPTMWTQYMDEPTLLELFKDVNRAFYFSPRVVYRTLRGLRSPSHLARVARGGLSVAKLQLIRPGSRRI